MFKPRADNMAVFLRLAILEMPWCLDLSRSLAVPPMSTEEVATDSCDWELTTVDVSCSLFEEEEVPLNQLKLNNLDAREM